MPVSVVTVAYNSGGCAPPLPRLARDRGRRSSRVIVVDNGGGGPEIDEADARAPASRSYGRDGISGSRPARTSAPSARPETCCSSSTPTRSSGREPSASWREPLDEPMVGAAMGRLLLLSDPNGAQLRRRRDPYRRASAGRRARPARGHASRRRARSRTRTARSWRSGGSSSSSSAASPTSSSSTTRISSSAGGRGCGASGIVLNPAADVLHDYEHGRNPTKYYFMERNRIVFVASAYSLRLLLLLAPVLLVAEVGLTAVSRARALVPREGRRLALVRRERRLDPAPPPPSPVEREPFPTASLPRTSRRCSTRR